LRHGVVNSGSRESVRRVPQGAATPAALNAACGMAVQRPVADQAPRAALLSRDRNFLFQTLLLPIIVVGSQIVFNGKLNSLSDWANTHAGSRRRLRPGCLRADAVGLPDAQQRGHVLWLLYTVPRSIESVLKEKAQLWGVLT
jgi:hypothetical protein